MSFFNTQMFLVMDDPVPEHIKQTFKLFGGARGWRSDLTGIDVAVLGQEIDLNAYGYVIVYANDSWHGKEALGIHNQIRGLRQDAMLLAIPVEIEAEQTFKIALTESTFNIPTFPGKP